MKKYIASIITISRVVCSILMLSCALFSAQFYLAYIYCGLTDMIDGFVARKTKTVTALGAGLDSFADLVFVTAAFLKLLPAINIPIWLWAWIGAIVVIRIVNLVLGFVKRGSFFAQHTVMNKITGFVLFLLPLTMSFIELKYSGVVACAVATFAAIQEGMIMAKSRNKKG